MHIAGYSGRKNVWTLTDSNFCEFSQYIFMKFTVKKGGKTTKITKNLRNFRKNI